MIKILTQRIRTALAMLLVLIAVCAVGFAGSPAVNAANEDPCNTVDGQSSALCQANKNAKSSNLVKDTIAKFSTIAGWIGGFLALFWIIIMSIKFASAGGDSQKAASARNGIVYAVVGLVVVLVAEIVIRTVLYLIK